MSSPSLDTPPHVLSALAVDAAILPPKARWEVFSRETAKVRTLVCTSPAMRKSTPQVAIALTEGSRYEQREAASELHRLISAGPLMENDVRVVHATGVTLVFAPWHARDDVRAVVRSVCASLHPERVTIDGSQLDNEIAVVMPGPGSRGDVALEIRHALHAFVSDADSLWRSARRLLSGRQEMQHWSLPLGCQVLERIEGRQVCWEIGFEDFVMLERALELVEARLAMGKDHLLRRWAAPASDQVETLMPSITLMAPENSREARTQMARLLQNMLFLLGRLGFDVTMPGDLRQPAPLPG